jgi:hypothetical protein
MVILCVADAAGDEIDTGHVAGEGHRVAAAEMDLGGHQVLAGPCDLLAVQLLVCQGIHPPHSSAVVNRSSM